MSDRSQRHAAPATNETRREFLVRGGQVAAAAATFSGTLRAADEKAPPADPAAKAPAASPAANAAVNPGGSDEIRLALIGCGGRGGGAAADALSVTAAPLRMVAMADVFRDRIDIVNRSLGERFKERVDVPAERSFTGFEAYKQAIDCLRPGDIAICATPVAFRAPHFAYAIEKGVHVFMEKPISMDGPSTRRIIELAGRADAKKLKVGVGLMCRHNSGRQDLFSRLKDGLAGDIVNLYGYRMHDPVHNLDLAPGRGEMGELAWQVKRFHNFLWASGGIFSDYYVHHIDEACWMKDAWPVQAEATGGRHMQGKINDQNFDNYAVEYTFADGAKFFYGGRTIPKCEKKFGVYGQGTKGAFVISARGHHPAKSAIYKGQSIEKDAVVWAAGQPETNPYRQEWEDLVAAIIADKPYNETVRGAQASLVTAMGRFAAHTGRTVTYQEMLESPDDLAAGVELLTDSSPPPLVADAEGRYPVPMPGKYKFEYRG